MFHFDKISHNSHMQNFLRKTKVLCHSPWSHHNSGWPYCVSGLYRDLNNDDGISFYTNSIISEIFQKQAIKKPWIGFLHATPSLEIEQMLDRFDTKLSLEWCQGIFGLSNYACDFIRKKINVPTERILLAVAPPKKCFDVNMFLKNSNRKLITIGHWMRRFESITKVNTKSYHKCVLRCTNIDYPMGIDVINYLSVSDYERIFQDNLIFLDLVDSSANNTVVECVVHKTPILINRLPALEEYLGKNYPLFYETLEEASVKCENQDLIIESHNYLKELDKGQHSLDFFVKSVANSEVYKNLRLPKFYL